MNITILQRIALLFCVYTAIGLHSVYAMDEQKVATKTPLTIIELPDNLIIEIFKQIYCPQGYITKPSIKEILKKADRLTNQDVNDKKPQDPIYNLRNLLRCSLVCKKLRDTKNKYFQQFEPQNADEAFYIDKKIKREKIEKPLAVDDISKHILTRKALLLHVYGHASDKCLPQEDAVFLSLLTLQFMKKNKYDINAVLVSTEEYEDEPLFGLYLKNQKSPLLEACHLEKKAFIQLLLAYGANPEMEVSVNGQLQTPLQVIESKIQQNYFKAKEDPEGDKNLIAIKNILLKAIPRTLSKLEDHVILEIILPYIFHPDTHTVTIRPNIIHQIKDKDKEIKQKYPCLWSDCSTILNLKGLLNLSVTCKKFNNLIKEKYLKKFELQKPYDAINLEYLLLNNKRYEQVRRYILLFTFSPSSDYSRKLIEQLPNEPRELRSNVRNALTDIIQNNNGDYLFCLTQEGILFSAMLILQFMKKNDYNINERFDKREDLPLMFACEEKNVQLVKLLLCAGTDINKTMRIETGNPNFPSMDYTSLELIKHRIKEHQEKDTTNLPDIIRQDNEKQCEKLKIIERILEDHNKIKAEQEDKQKEKKKQKCLVS